MSTTVYLQCLAHDPPLLSDEVGQRLYDLNDIRKYIRLRKLLVELLVDCIQEDIGLDGGSPNWLNTAAWFFNQHRDCPIGIVDEYGRDHPVEPTDICNAQICRCAQQVSTKEKEGDING